MSANVREKMIDFLQREHPEALPTSRQIIFDGNVTGEQPTAKPEQVRGSARGPDAP